MSFQHLSLDEYTVRSKCDPLFFALNGGKSNKYAYINYLPFTKPSAKYIAFLKELVTNFQPLWNQHLSIHEIRKAIAMMDENDNENNGEEVPVCAETLVQKIVIQYNNVSVTAFEVAYPGSQCQSQSRSRSQSDSRGGRRSHRTVNANGTANGTANGGGNGIIVDVHGGGYCISCANDHIQYAESLSKLSGYSVICLDYKLAPEYPLPYAVNELLILYAFILAEYNIPASNIAMSGGSAGGGLILLALQQITQQLHNDTNNNKQPQNINNTMMKVVHQQPQNDEENDKGCLYYQMLDTTTDSHSSDLSDSHHLISDVFVFPAPCCVLLNSPWTNLGCDTDSYTKNNDVEQMMHLPMLKDMAEWSVGNFDASLNTTNHTVIKGNAAFSPMFGPFGSGSVDGESSSPTLIMNTAMYFTVGACELLLDDTLLCAEKAHESGLDVRCDISPFMCHIWPEIANAFPEALEANVRAIEWIKHQFRAHCHSPCQSYVATPKALHHAQSQSHRNTRNKQPFSKL